MLSGTKMMRASGRQGLAGSGRAPLLPSAVMSCSKSTLKASQAPFSARGAHVCQAGGTAVAEKPTTSAATAGLPVTRQGQATFGSIIEGPYAFTAADYPLERIAELVTYLTEHDIAELDAGVALAAKLGLNIQDITKEHVQLPTFGPKLEAVREEVRTGRGFALLRGVPVDRYSRWEALAAYWIIGLYWGKPVSNNKKGHLIGHVKDIGHNPNDPVTRIYATAAAQPWHTDESDIVALLCLQTAESGGSSSWSSSVSVYNELLRRRPDLAKLLSEPVWWYDRKNEVPQGKLPYFPIRVFNFFKGYLSTNFMPNYFEASQRHPEVPRLTVEQREAMALFNELAGSKDLALHFILQQGDMQLLSNLTCLHMRSEYKDSAEKTRHLLRLRMATPEGIPLGDEYYELYGQSIEPGKRGGVNIEGFPGNIPLEAE